MTTNDTLKEILIENFHPELLEIEDNSAQHARHEAVKHLDHGETHFKVTMQSTEFVDKNRIKRQRMVFDAIKPLLQDNGGTIHAIELKLSA